MFVNTGVCQQSVDFSPVAVGLFSANMCDDSVMERIAVRIGDKDISALSPASLMALRPPGVSTVRLRRKELPLAAFRDGRRVGCVSALLVAFFGESLSALPSLESIALTFQGVVAPSTLAFFGAVSSRNPVKA